MEAGKFLRIAFGGVASFALISVGTSFAGPVASQQPDNTAANKANKDANTDQQASNPADRELAKKIRRSNMEDKSFSTYAHNVKLIVRDGEVTLKGPVTSDDEKAAIEAKATAILGADKVQNQLNVNSNSH